MNVSDAIDRSTQRRDNYLDFLKEWLSIASISTDPAYAAEMRSAAEWAASYMRGIEFRDVELFGPESHPAVYGELASIRGPVAVVPVERVETPVGHEQVLVAVVVVVREIGRVAPGAKRDAGLLGDSTKSRNSSLNRISRLIGTY